MATFEVLAAEIERIVRSPYPTQLKQLHDICRKASDVTISRWALARPCQIDALVANILEARQQWPYVVEMVTRLSSDRAVRNAFLSHDATLLLEIVSRAVKGDHEAWKYNAAAIAMLSHPLPSDVTLPAASQTFLLGVVDHATHEPSARSLRPAYQLLNGAMGPLIGLLSIDQLNRLEAQLLTIIKNIRPADSSCFSLCTLETMRLIINACETSSFDSSTSLCNTEHLLASTSDSPEWTPNTLLQFFSGSKAPKTLQLVVLQVLWACSTCLDDLTDEKRETLLLANTLIEQIPTSVREAWYQENRLIVHKLQEKVTLMSFDHELQMRATIFLSKLPGPGNMQRDTAHLLSSILSQSWKNGISFSMLSLSDLNAIINAVDEGSLQDFITGVPRELQRTSASAIVSSAHGLVQIMNQLSRRIGVDESIIRSILRAITSPEFAQSMDCLHRTISPSTQDVKSDTDGVCEVAVRQARNKITNALCGMALSAAVRGQQAERSIDTRSSTRLIELHALSSRTFEPCDHVTKHQHHLRSMELCSYQARTDIAMEHDWRGDLKNHFQKQAATEQEAMIILFSNACRDLEARCDGVEAPLREERAKVSGLQEQHDTLSLDYVALQECKAQSDLRILQLQNERDQYSNDMDSIYSENERLLEKTTQLEKKLHEAGVEAHDRIAALIESWDISKLESGAKIAYKENQLDDLRARVASVDEKLLQREKNIAELEESLAVHQSDMNILEADLVKSRNNSNVQNDMINALELERTDAVAHYTAAQSRHEALETQLRDQQNAHQMIIAGMMEQHDEQMSLKIANLAKDHFGQMQEMERKLQGTIRNHAQEDASLRRAYEERSAVAALQEKRLNDATRKFDRLRSLYNDKNQEITRLHTIQKNMMTAMCIADTSATLAQHERDLSAVAPEDNLLLSQEQEGLNINDNLASGLPDVSPSPNTTPLQPSPKRTRTRRSTDSTPVARRFPSSVRRSTSNVLPSTVPSQRQPLASVNGNKSPQRGARKSFGGGMLKVAEEDLDEAAFEGTQSFMETPGVHMSETYVPDDTTMM